jgi:SpoVK/Ycf46/Vps4 family AAA+-type ATPase
MKVEKFGTTKTISETEEESRAFKSTGNVAIYNSNFEYLLEELYRIDLIVRLCLKKYRVDQHEDMNDFRGLFISENEVNKILQTQPYEIKEHMHLDVELNEIKTITREIDRKKTESIKEGIELRLPLLEDLFHLNPFEVNAILICLAAELDLKYEILYSYLQNDVTKKRPTVDLVMTLLGCSSEQRFNSREYFSAASSLIKNRFIYFIDDGLDGHSPLLSKPIKVDERIINYLLGSNEMDQQVRTFSTIIVPKRSFEDLIVSGDNKNILAELMKWHSQMKARLMFFFHGPYGTGKKMTAEAICNELGTSMFIVDSKALIQDESLETLGPILREALLQNSSLYLEDFDALLKEETKINITNLIQELDRFPHWVFLSGEQLWETKTALKNHVFIRYAFPLPSFAHRKQLWESFLNGHCDCVGDADINVLASQFNFSAGQIKDAIFTACNVAMAKNPGVTDVPTISIIDIYMGCRAQSNKKLTTFAKKIDSHFAWEDIILPKDIKEQLKEIDGFIKYKGTVYADWGFGKKLSTGKGLNVLFSGPSGTGKTMAAGIIAREVGLDIYKIDLSSVVSKYIGETEKNLSKIFKEAETSNAILFFDEADALFGKRSEVKDAHDRYANIEIGYLLQKMEDYEGVVILATNLSRNIDDAFLRRMQFVVEFPFPDQTLRKLIWIGMFPENAPLADDIDYDFLCEKLKLAGGNIKNIALSAAFYAAEESKDIRMDHIMHAAKREYQKMGKTFLKADFEPYYELIEAEDK